MVKRYEEVDIKECENIFKECCPEFFIKNKIKYLHFFYCPISIALADVKEHIIEEYESIELLVLQLYDAGLRKSEQIAQVTGLDRNLVSRILNTEINAYAHIDKNTGELTQTGFKTLEENSNNLSNYNSVNVDINDANLKEDSSNIDNFNDEKSNMIIKHVIYDVKRELQIEAVTGSVVNIWCEQRKEQLFKNYSDKFDYIIPRESVPMDEDITREMRERLKEYKHMDILNDGDTIKDINNVKTQEIRYIRAYLAVFDGLPHPMIILKGWKTDNDNVLRKVVYMPTAISKSTQETLEAQGVSTERYLVREDSLFSYLMDNIGKFNFDGDYDWDAVKDEEIVDNDISKDQSIDELVGKAMNIIEIE